MQTKSREKFEQIWAILYEPKILFFLIGFVDRNLIEIRKNRENALGISISFLYVDAQTRKAYLNLKNESIYKIIKFYVQNALKIPIACVVFFIPEFG